MFDRASDGTDFDQTQKFSARTNSFFKSSSRRSQTKFDLRSASNERDRNASVSPIRIEQNVIDVQELLEQANSNLKKEQEEKKLKA